MSEYIVLVPSINSATASPNPVNINSQFTLTISISEIEKILEPVKWFSGEVFSGEV